MDDDILLRPAASGYLEDRTKQDAVRASVAELSLGDREELLMQLYVQLLDGVNWWDVQLSDERSCRQAIALRDEINEQLRQREET